MLIALQRHLVVDDHKTDRSQAGALSRASCLSNPGDSGPAYDHQTEMFLMLVLLEQERGIDAHKLHGVDLPAKNDQPLTAIHSLSPGTGLQV